MYNFLYHNDYKMTLSYIISININRDFEYNLSIEIIRTRFSENISSECMMYYVDALRFDVDAQQRHILVVPGDHNTVDE